MAEFCIYEKHGGICNLTGSYCNLGPCPNEEIEEFVPVHYARGENSRRCCTMHCLQAENEFFSVWICFLQFMWGKNG